LKNLEEGSFTGDVEETVKDCSINAASLSLSLSLCIWELCEGNLEGGLFYWEL